MRTILIAWVRPINVQRGGIHRIIRTLLESLPQNGYKCLYLIYKQDMQTFYINGTEDACNKIGIGELKDYIIDNDVDVIIDHHSIFTSEFVRLVKSFRFSVKIVSVFHSSPLFYEKTFNRLYLWNLAKNNPAIIKRLSAVFKILTFPFWLKRLKKQISSLYQNNYIYSDKLVLLSEYDIPNIKQYLHDADDRRLVNIPNMLSFAHTSDEDILKKKKKEVLVVARLYNNEKRIDTILCIWKIIQGRGYDDWILRIVGTGTDEKILKEYVAHNRVSNVVFEGRQESESYYEKASIFMMASQIEGWGLTLTESMQRGTVVVAFNSYPALHEIITDGFDGCIVSDNDITAYANKMERLMVNKDEREFIAKNALESCQRFAPEKIVKKWIQLVESL